MANILLPIQFAGFPQGFCFTTWDALGLQLSNAQKADLPGGTFYNYGDTKPAPEFQTYPWLRTIDGRWYSYDGDWVAPNNYSALERRWFAGTTTDLITYDGGDNQAPSDRSGPMWIVDADFNGRFPIGPGAVPSYTPTLTVGVGDNGGEGQHTLTTAELPAHAHDVPITKDSPSSGDTHESTIANQGVAGENILWPSNSTGGGAAHNNLPPYRGLYCIKPSGRSLYKV